MAAAAPAGTPAAGSTPGSKTTSKTITDTITGEHEHVIIGRWCCCAGTGESWVLPQMPSSLLKCTCYNTRTASRSPLLACR